MTGIGKRLRQFREALDLTQQDVASETAISRTYISTVEAERQDPSFSFVKTLSKSYSLSIDWLLTGYGEMFSNARELQEGDHVDTVARELPRLDCGLYGQGDFLFVPISSEKACCGKGSPIFGEYDIGESIAVRRAALGTLSAASPPYAVETQGRSMEGFGIREGSIVIVNPAEKAASGDVVLVAIGEKGAVKKYYERKEGIELVSSASESLRFSYEDIEDGWGVRICGRVMLVIAPPEDGV